jgi:2-polyprenyl-3-methyl-5-hydroxy-6-metoxy-1,4-benzoquinol methylase
MEKAPLRTCHICGNNAGSKYTLYDDRYGYPGLFEIAECFGCGHKFLLGDFTPELLKKLYTDYYPRSTFSLDQYRPAREVKGFLSWLNGDYRLAYSRVPKNVRVLDIGCGFGETLGYHKARGCEVYGVEADENIRRVADKFGFEVHVGLFDPNNYEPDFFDYVTMDQVIEHMADPVQILRGVARILKPGGRAIMTTPNSNGWGAALFGRKWIHWHAPYHLQHFSLKSMKIAAEKAGLILERAETITSSEWLYYQWVHLVTFPESGERSVFWSPLAEPSLKYKVLLKLIRLIHFVKINHLVTRVFDKLGIGDNYFVILRKSGRENIHIPACS